MDNRDIADRIAIEEEILSHVRMAMCVALDARIDEATAGHWLERFCFLADSFGRHMARMFAIKEEGGYMDFIVTSQQPTLAPKVETLVCDHREIPDLLRRIRGDARATRPDNLANLRSLRQRMRGFLDRLDGHHDNERNLWMDVYLIDLGGEG
jgi:hemerythrin-like domain-containing protein